MSFKGFSFYKKYTINLSRKIKLLNTYLFSFLSQISDWNRFFSSLISERTDILFFVGGNIKSAEADPKSFKFVTDLVAAEMLQKNQTDILLIYFL